MFVSYIALTGGKELKVLYLFFSEFGETKYWYVPVYKSINAGTGELKEGPPFQVFLVTTYVVY